MKEATTTTLSQIHLKPIDPKEVAIVFIVIPQWAFYETAPISLLHDGRLIDLEMRTLTSSEWDAFKTLRDNPSIIAVAFCSEQLAQ